MLNSSIDLFLRDLYLTALYLVHSVSSVAIVFLLWFHNTSRGYQNPMSFYQSLLTTSKETFNIASRGHCIGRDRTRIKLQFSRTAGIIATSSEWSQL